jgi:NhaP-type Na+/H+ or K+/H+ antiporter
MKRRMRVSWYPPDGATVAFGDCVAPKGTDGKVYENLAVVAAFVVCYSAIAGKVETSAVSGPIIYVGFGVLAGPLMLGWLDLDMSSQEFRVYADLTLALVLFIDAANVDFSVPGRGRHIPRRMLAFGLPLTIAAGWCLGWLIFDSLKLFEVAVLATMLAATDAALGKGVITNDNVPSKLSEGLNIESGLNDGICVPILLLFLAIAVGRNTEDIDAAMAVGLVMREIGVGLVVGLAMTGLGFSLLQWAARRDWLTEVWLQVPVVGLALGSFAIAQTLHGSGYIAAFSGGVLFGYLAKESTHHLVKAAEGTGEVLALATWVIFGAAVVGQSLSDFSWQVLLYALLSLTVVRMLPIYLALLGSGEDLSEKLFLGWFGPRGLASIVFGIIVLGHDLPGERVLVLTVVCTVLLSVVLHGVTANPLANAMGRRAKRSE